MRTALPKRGSSPCLRAAPLQKLTFKILARGGWPEGAEASEQPQRLSRHAAPSAPMSAFRSLSSSMNQVPVRGGRFQEQPRARTPRLPQLQVRPQHHQHPPYFGGQERPKKLRRNLSWCSLASMSIHDTKRQPAPWVTPTHTPGRTFPCVGPTVTGEGSSVVTHNQLPCHPRQSPAGCHISSSLCPSWSGRTQ